MHREQLRCNGVDRMVQTGNAFRVGFSIQSKCCVVLTPKWAAARASVVRQTHLEQRLYSTKIPSRTRLRAVYPLPWTSCLPVDARLTHSVTQQKRRKADRLTRVVESIEENVKGLEPLNSELGFLYIRVDRLVDRNSCCSPTRRLPPPEANFEKLQDVLLKRKGFRLHVSNSGAPAASLDKCIAADEATLSSGPATWDGQDDGGDVDVDHAASLEREREGRMLIDRADEEESQGIVDDPDDMPDDPGGCAEHALARASNTPVREDKTGTTNEAAETTDTETPDPTRPSRDPADATGDDERRPE
ncbi:hypothetical protein OG21DRAFT_1528186, partial [Imleria badia]